MAQQDRNIVAGTSAIRHEQGRESYSTTEGTYPTQCRSNVVVSFGWTFQGFWSAWSFCGQTSSLLNRAVVRS